MSERDGQAGANPSRGELFVISAPSGVGKSSLLARLLDEVDGLEFSISWTTRAPRRGEQHGREYLFTELETFRKMIDEGAFVEWAEVHGNCYGTAREQIDSALSRGLDVVLDIDVQGADQVRRSGVPAHFVFILPPDFATMEARLRGRGTDDGEIIARRLRNASSEMRQIDAFDYLVINEDLDTASAELAAIVRAGRATRARRLARARQIVATFPPVDPATGG